MKRTDLISELTEDRKPFKAHKKAFGKTEVMVVDLNEDYGKMLKKPPGKYCTVKFNDIIPAENDKETENAVIYCLKTLFKVMPENVLIAGLGNRDITPDALGVITADKIKNTRHLKENFRKVCTVIPSVAGKTGIESGELISAAIEKIKPDSMIIIDALASKNKESVCKSIQLTDVGLYVGSGAYKSKTEFSQKKYGFPVIAIGMPTVIDFNKMMLTPKNIDSLINSGAQLMANAINRFLHS